MIVLRNSVLFCVALLMLVGEAAIAQGPPPVLVVTDTVREMQFHNQVTLVGRTEAKVASQIVSEVYGRVKSINVSEGVRVKVGQSLITIDSDRIKFNLDSKSAEATQARLQAELVLSQKERAEELFRRNLISNTGLDSAVTWANITQEQYNQLEAERQLLELDYRNSRVPAPFSGYTGKRLVDVGEWVNPGMPVFEMVDISSARVKVDLPERYFGRVAVGSSVTISRSPESADVPLGVVTGITPNASEETHTFPVIIEVPNPDDKLGGGMLVKATLELDEMFTSLAVSKDAVVRQGNQTLVYTIVDGKASPIPVLTTSTDGNLIAVASENLSTGMPVVVRGNERIFPGSPVQVAGAEMSAGKTEPGQQASVEE